ncbi:hypothetical protein DA83_25015 [Pseudomonas sp. 250J]|uniref:hypothetical protein n=1 Tax=unclassified Pseudomonas TaxID=196821 RepID=UPI00068315F4|nr:MULTISPECIES: hypothetical protein [unclassified Pseudomonas]KNX78054.1 hypothetical protein DA83_25015 [Pseudomonas sp. 250J]QZA56936.1 hypothetical protein K2O50_13135 [Pseudomonas sp. 2hn]
MKKRLTKTEVEKLAIRYARLFHGPTVSGGPKTREYWRAMFLFGCLAICAVIGVFVTALWPEYTLIPGLAALCLEGWALLLWVRTYEPQFREHVLRKEGVLRFSDAFEQSRMGDYKSTWLAANIPVDSGSYLEIAENLQKVRALSGSSRQSTRSRAERFIDYLLALKFARSIFTVGFAALALKIVDYVPLMKDKLVNVMPAFLPKMGFALFFLFFALLIGALLVTWVCAILKRFLEVRYQRCSAESLDLFMQALLDRASLTVYDSRMTDATAVVGKNVLDLKSKRRRQS